MEKFPLTVKNILKIIIWIALIGTFIELFGLVLGIILYALTVLVWGIALTLIREYLNNERKEVKNILHIIFTTNPILPFTAYGCYCSPSYGVDGRTNGLEPVDGLDSACERHDNAMLQADRDYDSGAITKAERVSLKNKGDLIFMREAITSENSASGIYLIILEIGFILRIISRSLTKV
jgi:hypothetical protein